MIRQDILLLIPALLVAMYQVLVIWPNQDKYNNKDTEISGAYDEIKQLRITYWMYLIYAVLFLQLSIPIFSISNSINIPLIALGYIFIILGAGLSLRSLRVLKENWTGLSQYRIKKGQQLVTSGPYRIIRHPIYTSVVLELVGFELAANSWLSILIFIICGFFFYQHTKKEEHLLELKFGEKFKSYKNKTYRFLPYIF